MKAAYSGNARPFVLVLAAADDAERTRPVLEELDARGLEFAGADGSATEDMARRACATIAFLSEHTASDEAFHKLLLTALAAEENTVVPVRLDATGQGEAIEGLLYAQNAIFAANYPTPAELADRVYTAEALQHPHVTQAQKKAERTRQNVLRALVAVVIAGIVALVWHGVNAASGTDRSALTVAEEYGMTEEDLESIREVIIVGEHFAYYTEDDLNDSDDPVWILDVASQEFYDDGSSAFFWHGDEDADGEAAVHTTYDDLSFLTLMPNLDYLYAAEADLTSLPSLAEIGAIDDVAFYNCELGGLDWLADTPVHGAVFFDCDVDDLSPLSSCSNLESVRVDAHGVRVSMEGFAPKNLGILQLTSVADADLSPLADCPSLRSLAIHNSDVSDFSFLEGMGTLHVLELSGLERVQDLSPLATCTNLKTLQLDNLGNLRSLDFLRGLTALTELELYGVPLENFDFLENLNPHFDKIGFSCDGSIGMPDLSGFAHLTSIDQLHIDAEAAENGDFATLVAPFIEHLQIYNLNLSNCGNIDLAALANVRDALAITGGDLTSLEGLQSDSLCTLELHGIGSLTSLNGIEGLARFTQDYNYQGTLVVAECPRLADFGALANVRLGVLELANLLASPDFANVHTTELVLENIAGIADLTPLEALPEGEYYRFSFPGFDELTDLSPLRRLGGELLQVPPQVADQAAELVEEGIFKEYEVVFPEGGWNADDIEIELTSLDEMGTLSPALLEHVLKLELIGDDVYPSDTWIELDNFVDDGQSFDIVIRDEQGEVAETRSGRQGTMEGLAALAPLAELRELRLYAQGMTSLDGIQELGSLEGLDINWTWTVEDFSPIFALPGLRWLSLPGVGITSIQGIQNLGELEEATLSWNDELTDLTPLLDCPNLALVRVSSDMEEAIASLDGTTYSFELEIEQTGE